MITTGALNFERVGLSELIITAGPDSLRTITSAAAMHEHAVQIRAALAQLAQHGTPRIMDIVLNHNRFSSPYVPYLFTITAEGSQRKLDVGTRGYICVADHRPGVLTSGLVEPSVLESLADFLDG